MKVIVYVFLGLVVAYFVAQGYVWATTPPTPGPIPQTDCYPYRSPC